MPVDLLAPSQAEIRLGLTKEENRANSRGGHVMWLNEGINIEQEQFVLLISFLND